MLKPSIAAVIAVSVLLSGCAMLQPEPREVVDNTRTYAAGRDAMWDRILSTAAENSMIIRRADPANGVITAEREIASPNANSIYDWARCGSWDNMMARALSQRIEVTYLVQRGAAGTNVTVNGRFQELRLDTPLRKAQWVSCASTGSLERSLLDSLHY
jgi:hypothetical protein